MLAKAGWHVAIIEKAAFPRRKVCGEFISATTLPLLFELGIGKEFLGLAGPEVKRVGLFENDTRLTAPMPSTSGLHPDWGRALGREHLDLLLLDAAARAGARLCQPWKANELKRTGAGWTCVIEGAAGSTEIEAPVVIAATGSWERGPLSRGGRTAHRNGDLLGFKAHFIDCDLAVDLMPLLVFPGGYGGMVHSDGGRVSISCCIRRDVLSGCRNSRQARAADAVLQHIENSCAGVREALQRASRSGAWLSAGPIRPGIRQRYSNGVFISGNLAGEAHPIIAEGISMAIQSSALLCRHLVDRQEEVFAGRGHADIGEQYAAEWRRAFALRIRAAAAFAHLAMRPHANAPVRPLIRCFPHILTLGARFAGKAKSIDLPSR
jgi:flavin-dependent dehydrogenase